MPGLTNPQITEAIGLPFKEAIDFFRQKIRVPTERWNDVWRTAHSHQFMVAGATTDALLKDFQDALRKSLEQGTTFATFQKDFDAIVAKHGWEYNGSRDWRSGIIYDTNMATSYAAGRYAQLTDPDVLAQYPYWQYAHTACQHPRLQHIAWDGTTLRADDPWWDTHYPPNGWRCGCRVRPISRGDLGRMGKKGPDPTPAIETRPWVDRVTGVVHQVPVGIDPGFDYNPGKAWKNGGAALPVKSDPMKRLSKAGAEKPFNPIDANEPGKANPALRQAQLDWADDMTPSESKDLAYFKETGGRTINAVLRGEVPAGARTLEIAANLQKALRRAKSPADMILHRGVGAAEAALYQAHEPGQIITAKAFTSASISAKVAKQFAAADTGGRVVEIVVRKRQKGVAYVHPFPTYRYPQFEVLLAIGARLKVLRADNDLIRLELDDDDDE